MIELAVSIRNLDKFFRDHPEHHHHKTPIMKKAQALITKGSMIYSTDAAKIMGNLTKQFFLEFDNDDKHIAIWIADSYS